jgi:uncharacterized protein YkwD
MRPESIYLVAIVAFSWLVAAPFAKAAKVQEQRAVQKAEPARASGPTASGAACPGQNSLSAPVATQLRAMRCLTDFARRRAGLEVLAESDSLNQSASQKSADILRCDSFSHFACGRNFSYWIRETGYMSGECWLVGENLAWGVGQFDTVRSIFQAWVSSPSHRANILGGFTELGLSLRIGRLEGRKHVRVWTQHFGMQC